MKDIYQEIDRELDQGHDVILATIVAQKGSAPRAPGTRFLVRPDGSFEGTIGGGKVEAGVLAEAPKVFKEKRNRIIRFRLTGEEAAETEMICGGELEIHLEFFSGGDASHRQFFNRIIDFRQKGTPAIMATLLGEVQSTAIWDFKFLYVPGEDRPLENLSWIAPIRKELSKIHSKSQPLLLTTGAQGKERKIFLEPLFHLPTFISSGPVMSLRPFVPWPKRLDFR